MQLDTSHPKYRGEITTEFGTQDLVLDLGVGNRKMYPESVGIDVRDYPAVDIICDATKLIPLPDNSVKHCYSYHTIEHIPVSQYSSLFDQVYRVCRHDALIDWWFPYWTHRTAYDFSHVSYLNEYCFEGWGFQSRFIIHNIEYWYEDEFKDLPEAEREFARKHYMNAVKEMRIRFRPRKDENGNRLPMDS
jgi:predicted SAM-dependent methyltransferase